MSKTIRPRRPTAAYKLLTTLLYYEITETSPGDAVHGPQRPWKAPLIEVVVREGARPTLRIRSVRRLSRLLGTGSERVNRWFLWLETQGYLTHLAWSEDKRTVELRIRQPANYDRSI